MKIFDFVSTVGILTSVFALQALAQESDLGLNVFDSPDPVSCSGQITYSVSIENLGPQTAPNVRLDFTHGPEADFVSVAVAHSGTACAYTAASASVVCTTDVLPVGQLIQSTIVTQPSTGGTALAASDVSSDAADFNEGNNTSLVQTVIIDGDEIADDVDNCPCHANPLQENNDGDTKGDACDPDDDNDGISDTLDRLPFDGSNANCTINDGTNATLVGATISAQQTTCAAKESVDVSGTTNVGIDGDLLLISEEVSLTDTSVTDNGLMQVINADPCPGCSVCGNGILETWEQCDDGNTVDGDGCSAVCVVVEWRSNPVPGPFVMDGSLADFGGPAGLYPDDPIESTGVPFVSPTDWRRARVAHDGLDVCFGLVGAPGTSIILSGVGETTVNIFLDTDVGRATGYRGGLDQFPIGAEYRIQGTNLWAYTGTGLNSSWAQVSGGVIGWASSAERSELCVSRSAIGLPPEFRFFFFGDNEDVNANGVPDFYPDGAPGGMFGEYFGYIFGPLSP